jgi:hypothetical protein
MPVVFMTMKLTGGLRLARSTNGKLMNCHQCPLYPRNRTSTGPLGSVAYFNTVANTVGEIWMSGNQDRRRFLELKRYIRADRALTDD